MKTLTVEIFNQNRPEYGQDVTLSITHNGYAPDKDGEIEIYVQGYCEYTAEMTISSGPEDEAHYTITSDTALNGDTYGALIARLHGRIVDLFGGWTQ